MNRILDEPPCRASMKNSSNERMVERKRSWKHKVKPCDDLEGASRRYDRENLELRKRKRWTLEPRITSSWTISGRKELKHLEEIRIRFLVCLSFIKLKWWHQWICILFIRVEKWLKRDIARTWEGLQQSTGRIETMNKSIWEHRNRSLEQTTIRI